jgi:hypothetical protein
MSSILWVGPGMGDYFNSWWTKAFLHLLRSGLIIDHLRAIDLKGAPKPFFNPNYSRLPPGFTEETLRNDFFDQGSGWDIIIVDFIEAWQFGNNYWEIGFTPFRAILREWERKIFKLMPKQVWVVHDDDPYSTIIPNLAPEYELIDLGLKPFFAPFKEIDIWQLID